MGLKTTFYINKISAMKIFLQYLKNIFNERTQLSFNFLLFKACWCWGSWIFFFKPLLQVSAVAAAIISNIIIKKQTVNDAIWDVWLRVTIDSKIEHSSSFEENDVAPVYVEFWNLLPGKTFFSQWILYMYFDLFGFLCLIFILVVILPKQSWFIEKFSFLMNAHSNSNSTTKNFFTDLWYVISHRLFSLFLFGSLLSILAFWYLMIETFYDGRNEDIPAEYAANSFYLVDSYAIGMKFFLSIFLLSSLTIVNRIRVIPSINTHFKDYLLVYIIGIMFLYVLPSLTELFGIFLCIEGVSLAIIILLCFNYTHELSLKAAGAYYVLGSLSTFAFLTALTFLYGSFHSLTLRAISFSSFFQTDEYQKHGPAIFLATIFLTLAFLYKLGAFPMHFWVVEVYKGADWNILWFMTTAYKFIIFGTTARVLYGGFMHMSEIWKFIIITSVIGSAIFGAIGAFSSPELKEVLGYISISHTGFLLLAFMCDDINSAFTSVFEYLIYYNLSYTLMIAIIAAVLDKPQEVQGLKYISQLSAISSQYPKYTKYILIAFFALAGIPPMSSFWFKFYTLQEVFNSGYYITTLIILLLQLPIVYYYLQFVKNIAIGFKWFKIKGSLKPIKFTYVRSEDDEDDHIVSAYLRYMEETYTSTELFELALLFSLSLVVSGLYLVFFWFTG